MNAQTGHTRRTGLSSIEDDVILDNIVDTGSVYSYNVCEIPESICDRQTGITAGTMIEDINTCEVAG